LAKKEKKKPVISFMALFKANSAVGSKGYRGVITTGVSVRTYVGGANA
jgi:hypothetical protein